MKNTIAIYPGTFDPLTRGHEDIIRKASCLFDTLIVAVAASSRKNPLFSLQERVEIARHESARYGNVRVVGFEGLLYEFVREQKANVVIRGLRAVSDFEYEFQMAGMNRMLMPEFETIFMTPNEQFQFISGTIAREVALLGGDVSKFVGCYVEERLRQKALQLKR